MLRPGDTRSASVLVGTKHLSGKTRATEGYFATAGSAPLREQVDMASLDSMAATKEACSLCVHNAKTGDDCFARLRFITLILLPFYRETVHGRRPCAWCVIIHRTAPPWLKWLGKGFREAL